MRDDIQADLENKALKSKRHSADCLQRACYAAGERVMAKHARWGWIPATVRWQSETAVSLETDHHYLITVPLEDVKPHNRALRERIVVLERAAQVH